MCGNYVDLSARVVGGVLAQSGEEVGRRFARRRPRSTLALADRTGRIAIADLEVGLPRRRRFQRGPIEGRLRLFFDQQRNRRLGQLDVQPGESCVLGDERRIDWREPAALE